jgi:hypothetical protein
VQNRFAADNVMSDAAIVEVGEIEDYYDCDHEWHDMESQGRKEFEEHERRENWLADQLDRLSRSKRFSLLM